ncbi:hypothetical protein [Gelidibacter japonicus]|uniref:hypothetical protein n=1 Tax=Gelidibacter japonicus TaxID=1962232 RepID=UPI003A9220B8
MNSYLFEDRKRLLSYCFTDYAAFTDAPLARVGMNNTVNMFSLLRKIHRSFYFLFEPFNLL